MKIHTHEMLDSIERRIAQLPHPAEGELVVSDLGVMESACAPYVGQVCAEYLHGSWVYQPYSRITEYASSVAQAERMLAELTDDDDDGYEEYSVYCEVCGLNWDIDDPCPFH